MTQALYFEDLTIGRRFESSGYTISKEEAVRFAREYDPQYFHVDEEAALNSSFGRLAVSGWHTAAITMRLKTETDLTKVDGGLIGMGLESMKWPKPVYPDDTLTACFTITAAKRSASKPTHGVVSYEGITKNQDGEVVMEMKTAVWVPCKPSV